MTLYIVVVLNPMTGEWEICYDGRNPICQPNRQFAAEALVHLKESMPDQTYELMEMKEV